jgi:hypothetical protein
VVELVGTLLSPIVLAPLILAATGLLAVFGSVPIDAAAKRFGGAWLVAAALFLWSTKDTPVCVAYRRGEPAPNMGAGSSDGDWASKIIGGRTGPSQVEIRPPAPSADACENRLGSDMLGTTGIVAHVQDLQGYPTPAGYRLTIDFTPYVVALLIIAVVYLFFRGPRMCTK